MPIILNATTRTDLGRQAKKVRKERKIPAVMYGHGSAPAVISLDASEFRTVRRAAGTSTLIDVVVDGAAPQKALIQEIQVHHLTMEPNHVDLRQVRMDEAIEVEVPLVFTGEAAAVKELAGTLVHAFDSLMVKCLPADLPHEIRVDLSVLKTFDDVITIADLALPKSVQILQAMDDVLATVTAPMTEEQLKKLEEPTTVDVTAVKTEAEEKKAEKESKEAEEAAAAE